MNINSKAVNRSRFYLEKSGLTQHFYNIRSSVNIVDFYNISILENIELFIDDFVQKHVNGTNSSLDIVEKNGLFIHGASATGKTMLASYIIYTLIQNAPLTLTRGCLFVNLTAFIDMLRPGRFGGEELLERAVKADVLVLDDFGTNVLSDWVFERLYFIINTRRERVLPIIYTSNLSMNELKQSMSALDPVAAQRLLTRVEATSTPLFIN